MRRLGSDASADQPEASPGVRGVRRRPTTTPRQGAALFVLVLTVVVLAVDATALAVAVPALTKSLAPSATQLLWIGDSYSFALASLLVTMGTLSDRWGRKRVLLAGSAGFGVMSMLCAFSPSAETLIASRALLGASAAALMPSTLSIIRNMYDDVHQRRTAIAIWSAGATAGAAAGPLVAGILLERFWWGSVFVINVPVVAIIVLVGRLALPESKDSSPGVVDLASVALSVAAVLGFVSGVKLAVEHGLTAAVATAAVVSGVTGIMFVRRQRRLSSPLVDIRLFRIPAFAGAICASFVSIFALSGLLFVLAQQFQFVRGYSALETGVRMLPMTLSSVVVALLVGQVARRFRAGPLISAGLLCTSLGLFGLAFLESRDDFLGVGLALLVVGLGEGVAYTLTTESVVSAVPPERAGAATAVAETAYEMGVAMGIAILGSLMTLTYRSLLTLPPHLSESDADATRDSIALALASRPAGVQSAAAEAFTGSLQIVSGAAAVALVVASALAVVLIRPDRSAVPPPDA